MTIQMMLMKSIFFEKNSKNQKNSKKINFSNIVDSWATRGAVAAAVAAAAAAELPRLDDAMMMLMIIRP